MRQATCVASMGTVWLSISYVIWCVGGDGRTDVGYVCVCMWVGGWVGVYGTHAYARTHRVAKGPLVGVGRGDDPQVVLLLSLWKSELWFGGWLVG